ncbi:unnamed protein product [Sphagnum jensenii]|uniref:ATPase AAA-type core domain-containing protein n=1 Tax=Sphagnum jensenii TaxID=128206 RepID=A0ABP1BND3_9BRYO
MARACAAQTNATYLKLAGQQLVQMFIGDGAKLVWDAFQLVKEKVPCIIFIDRLMQLERSGLIGILLGLLVCHLGLRTFA